MWPQQPRNILDVPHTRTFRDEALLAFSDDNPNLAHSLVADVTERHQALDAITQGNEEMEQLIGNELIALSIKAAAVRRREFEGVR